MNNNNNNDIVAARRRALAEALQQGETVVVTPTGEVAKEKENVQDTGIAAIQVALMENLHRRRNCYGILLVSKRSRAL